MIYIYNEIVHSYLSGVSICSSPNLTTYGAGLEWSSNVNFAMAFDSDDLAMAVIDFIVDVIDAELEDVLHMERSAGPRSDRKQLR